jgi:hypothetical protein
MVAAMKDAAKCREQARECRRLAHSVSEEQRQQLLTMAEIWESLARDRETRGEAPGLSNLAPTKPLTEDDSDSVDRA